MKKILIIIFVLCFIFFPNVFDASIKDNIKSMNLDEALKMEKIAPNYEKLEKNDNQVSVYLFMGQGEEKSVEFLKYVNSIYNEYGNKFNLVVYEIGSNQYNSTLMDNVIDYLHSDVITVPMIVIGDTHFVTWEDNLKENFIKIINLNYEMDDKVDKVQEVLIKYYRNYDLIIWGIIISVLVFITGLVFVSLKDKN